MPVFVSHVTLTREGLDEIKNLPERLAANRNLGRKSLQAVGTVGASSGSYRFLVIGTFGSMYEEAIDNPMALSKNSRSMSRPNAFGA